METKLVKNISGNKIEKGTLVSPDDVATISKIDQLESKIVERYKEAKREELSNGKIDPIKCPGTCAYCKEDEKGNCEGHSKKGEGTIIKWSDDPKLTKEFDSTIYSIRYKYGYNWSCYQNLATKLIQIMAENKEHHKKFIDIGSGVGWFSDMTYFNISRNIKGIDFSKHAILFHARRMYPAIDFEIADMYTYDYKDYEVAILTEVLEHSERDLELLGKLPKGCIVYATVPFGKERMDITHVREYDINSTMERYRKVMEFTTCEKFEQYIIIRGVIK